jgi:macrolide-specific efflux system membrane fusion protein
MKSAFSPLAALLVLAGAARLAPAAAPDANLDHCLISLIEEAEVPAQELGVLKEIKFKEGQAVAAGDLLAQIDDAKARMEVTVAKAKLAAAKVKADDDINVRYAKAKAEAAKAGYERNAAANRNVPNSVPAELLTEKLMEYTEATLGIEKAQLELRIAGHEAEVAKAEVEAAEDNLRRHRICSPQIGLVDKVHRHAGEWVQAGDPVMHVIRIDRLRVDGFVSAADYGPGDLRGGAAEVHVVLAGGRPRTFSGKVVFVDPNIQAGGVFLVRVEVQNEQENDCWLLSPGLSATMTIRTK